MTRVFRDLKGFFLILKGLKNPFKSLKIRVIRVTILSNYYQTSYYDKQFTKLSFFSFSFPKHLVLLRCLDFV
jgi:hypothetical protein